MHRQGGGTLPLIESRSLATRVRADRSHRSRLHTTNQVVAPQVYDFSSAFPFFLSFVSFFCFLCPLHMSSRRAKQEGNEEEEDSRDLRSRSSSLKKHTFTFTRSSSSASSDNADDDGTGPSESMKLFEAFAKEMNITPQELYRKLYSDERRISSDSSFPGLSTSTSDTLTHAEQAETLFRGGDTARFERLLISLTLNGKVQILHPVTAILHAVVISPSSAAPSPALAVTCYLDLATPLP